MRSGKRRVRLQEPTCKRGPLSKFVLSELLDGQLLGIYMLCLGLDIEPPHVERMGLKPGYIRANNDCVVATSASPTLCRCY